MDIYVVSQAIAARMHTPSLLKAAGVPFTLVVDNQQQAKAAKALGYSQSLVARTADLVAKRNFITQQAGSWYIGMDDNIRSFTAVAQPWRTHASIDTSKPNPDGTKWRAIFNQPCTPQAFIAELENLKAKCLDAGVPYAGVATMENPFFRGKRYGLRRFVKSKVFVMDPQAGIVFKHRLCHDSYASALSVAKYGRTLVDSYLHYEATWYEAGGLGTLAEREAAGLREQLQMVIDEFPGLVGMAHGKNSALRFLLTTDAGINRWRTEHNWLRRGVL